MPVTSTSKEACKKADHEIQRAKIYALLKRNPRKMGWTNREIGEKLGIEHSTIAARRNKMVEHGVLKVLDTSRKHKVKNAHLYRTGYPVVLA